MSVALQLFEDLSHTSDDGERNRIIAHAFEQLEARYPELAHVATRTDLSETELRLQREIEGIRLEIKAVDANLKLALADVQKEMQAIESSHQQGMQAIESNLQQEMQKIDSDHQHGMQKIESRLQQEMHKIESSLKLEIEGMRKDIKQVEVHLHQAIAAQTRWIIGGLAALGTLFKLLDMFV